MTLAEFLPIPGYEAEYLINRNGTVLSLARRGSPGINIMKPHTNAAGYLVVTLTRNNTKKSFGLHQLILMAFVGPRPPGLQACHNDGDRLHNDVSNLRWDTASANALDQVKHGVHHQAGKSTCKSGHEYSSDNTYRDAQGKRHCRSCNAAASRRYVSRRAAAA